MAHVTRRTAHVTWHTSHVTRFTRHTAHVTVLAVSRPPSPESQQLSKGFRLPEPGRHRSHVTRHTSHVTRHTSHVALHTAHLTRNTAHEPRFRRILSLRPQIAKKSQSRGPDVQEFSVSEPGFPSLRTRFPRILGHRTSHSRRPDSDFDGFQASGRRFPRIPGLRAQISPSPGLRTQISPNSRPPDPESLENLKKKTPSPKR